MLQFITHASTVTGATTRYALLDGRKHLVVPVVALVAGVVNGFLVEPEELSHFADAWNGRPIPIRHPKQDGEYISANLPEVIERQVVGQFFNAHIADGEKLAGELWLDIAKCEALGGDALATLHRLQAGKPVEVSTAYFCDVNPSIGNHNGQTYTGIQRNLRPDHLALLPDEIGACSWKDGCGAPRVNSEAQPELKGCPCRQQEEQMDQETNVTQAADVTANETDAAEVTAAETVAESDSEGDAATDDLTQLAQLVKELGGVQKLAEAMRAITANVDSRKADLVAALSANAACAFTADDLEALSVAQLEKLDRSLRPANYAGRPAANVAAKLPEGHFVIGGEVYRPYQPVAKQ